MTRKLWLIVLLIMMAASCSAESTAQPTPAATPTAVLNVGASQGSVVTASAEIVPARFSRIGISVPARIESVEVQIGDQVEAGQSLVRLSDQSDREAAVVSAERELLDAEQALQALQEDWSLEAARLQLELAQARDELKKAENRLIWNQKNNRATEDTIEYYEAQLVLAEKKANEARSEYNRHKDESEHNSDRARARVALEQAEQHKDEIVRLLNWYKGEPTDIDQALLEANVAIAMAKVENAAREFEKWKDGPDPDAVASAQARLADAKAQLAAAEAYAADGEIRAPFAGVIADVMVTAGEAVVPGTQLLLITDPDYMVVETTDLSERDIDRVKIGQDADIYIEPLEMKAQGRVLLISPSANTIGGDVVYMIRLEFDEQPEGLLWGMSAEVDIVVGE
jgi:HlyD family secretion protein